MRLPDGASLERTQKVMDQVEAILRETPGVKDITSLGGTDFTTSTSNSNVATVFASLDPWEERRAPDRQLTALLAQVQAKYSQIPEAIVFGFGLPPILGLGSTGGFEFMLEDHAGGDTAQLAEAAQAVTDASRQRPEISALQSSFRAQRSAVQGGAGHRQGPNAGHSGYRRL